MLKKIQLGRGFSPAELGFETGSSRKNVEETKRIFEGGGKCFAGNEENPF